MFLVLFAVMRLILVFGGSRVAPPQEHAPEALTTLTANVDYSSAFSIPPMDDESSIGAILEPRGILPPPPDPFIRDTVPSWLTPVRLDALSWPSGSSLRRRGGLNQTVFPMRTYFCDSHGVVDEQVVDWSYTVAPAALSPRP